MSYVNTDSPEFAISPTSKDYVVVRDALDELKDKDSADDLYDAYKEVCFSIGTCFILLDEVKAKLASLGKSVDTSQALDQQTDDEITNRRGEIRQELSELSKLDKTLKAERADIDAELFRRFEERGTSGTRTDQFTISVSEDDNYPEMTDRTAFEDYVLATGKLHLLQKRLSLTAIQEELAFLMETYKDKIEDLQASRSEQEAEIVYHDLTKDEDGSDVRLAVLKSTNSLVDHVILRLQNEMAIPGVSITTKKTINQVKRRR